MPSLKHRQIGLTSESRVGRVGKQKNALNLTHLAKVYVFPPNETPIIGVSCGARLEFSYSEFLIYQCATYLLIWAATDKRWTLASLLFELLPFAEN
jgi:hypothetical protein